MEGRVGITIRIDTPGFISLVCWCIPTPTAEVDTAAKSHRIIDDHHLLMMTGTEGMMIVELKMEMIITTKLETESL